MQYSEAKKIYKAHGGAQRAVDKSKSYLRGGAWHLVSLHNTLLAVVNIETRSCLHGQALLAWSRQFTAGLANL